MGVIGSSITPGATIEDGLEVVAARETTPRQLALRRFLRHRLAVISLVVILLMALAAALAPLIAPYHPTAQDLLNTLSSPSSSHFLGTDDLGRDIYSRLIYGARITLGIGFGAALVVFLIGILIGATAGYIGGWVDTLLMRFVDLVLSFPSLFLLLILAAYTGVNVVTIILFIGFFGWMHLARLVRSQFLVIRELEYVQAARASGVGGWRMMWRHMLPNALAPVIVNVTFAVAIAMYVEAALDFLGFGLAPDVATWGNMLAGSQQYIAVNPLLTVAPGILLTIAILAVNFIGDGLRDALDPRGK